MTTWVLRLIVANVVVFILTYLRPVITEVFMFVPVLVLTKPWTLVTYMFLHAGISHILFNMLGLFFFGPRLEEQLGGTRFLTLYFISGFMGALFSFLTPYTAIVGASGAVYGVLLGFAYFWPREPIYIWGVLPVESRWLVVFMTLLSLFGGFGGGDNIAHFAHLGGFVGGFLYLRVMDRMRPSAQWQRKMEMPEMRSLNPQRWKNIRRENLHEVNRAEYDRILDKIKAQGIGSLTPDERAFLDRFSAE